MLCRSLSPTNRLYLMSRHFVWLTPLANLLLFLIVGVLLALLRGYRPGAEGGSASESSAPAPSSPR